MHDFFSVGNSLCMNILFQSNDRTLRVEKACLIFAPMLPLDDLYFSYVGVLLREMPTSAQSQKNNGPSLSQNINIKSQTILQTMSAQSREAELHNPRTYSTFFHLPEQNKKHFLGK